MLTAIAGGIIRDVVAREVPMVMGPDDLYAIPAMLGAIDLRRDRLLRPAVDRRRGRIALATVLRLAAHGIPLAAADRARAN